MEVGSLQSALLLQFRNLLPYCANIHVGGFFYGPVAGLALIGPAVFAVEQVVVER